MLLPFPSCPSVGGTCMLRGTAMGPRGSGPHQRCFLPQETLLQPHTRSAADDKGGMGGMGRRGKLPCHRYIEDATGHHSWLLLASPCCPTWSQCLRVIPSSAQPKGVSLEPWAPLQGVSMGIMRMCPPTVGVPEGPGRGFLSQLGPVA